MSAATDITELLRSRHTLLWVVSREEGRVERALLTASADAGYPVHYWDCADGITDVDGATIEDAQDPSAGLAWLADRTERGVLVMRDLHKWLDPIVLRQVRSLAKRLQSSPPDSARAIVVLTPSAEIPPELTGHATVIDYPLPDRTEIASLLDDVIASLPEGIDAAPNGTRDAAIDAAVGLTAEQAGNCYARSLVATKRIDPAIVASEKKRVIAQEKVLTWYDPDPRGLAAVGGLDVLKSWLTTRKAGFSARARAYGLPAPRGVMLAGVPGCGKSLTAKAVAAAWGMPLLRLDMGSLKSKYVGESEGNIRRALQVAETVSPCVLWLDEIEKALGGSTGAQGDGGVSSDALGAILSWMQDRIGSVFVVATANDVSSLPPELLRKGRFDELFFVDLPTSAEREAVFRAALASHGIDPDPIVDASLLTVTDGYSGAEIAALIPDAMFAAFADGERPVTLADLVQAARGVVPLSKTAATKIDALRAWARGKCRRASADDQTATSTGRTRILDL